MYSYVTRMYPFVLVCYPYVTRMYSYVPVCIVCYSYVIRMLLVVLVWSISQDHGVISKVIRAAVLETLHTIPNLLISRPLLELLHFTVFVPYHPVSQEYVMLTMHRRYSTSSGGFIISWLQSTSV